MAQTALVLRAEVERWKAAATERRQAYARLAAEHSDLRAQLEGMTQEWRWSAPRIGPWVPFPKPGITPPGYKMETRFVSAPTEDAG